MSKGKDDDVEVALLSPAAKKIEAKPITPDIEEFPDEDEVDINSTSEQRTNVLIDEDEDIELETKASVITQIMVPVCITMVLVIFIVKTLYYSVSDSVSQAMVYTENPNATGGEKFLGSLINALIFVGMIIVVTIIFVVLYKYRCLKLIFAWLLLSTGVMLGFFGGYLLYNLLDAGNIPMDWITFAIILWNFAIVGNIAIFWHASVKVNQAYLIAISVILAVVFTRLPEWTTWTILGAIAIYDLFAVLCPRGPLRVLVETAQERDEPIPALIYNASIIMMMGSKSDEENAEDKSDEDGQPKHRGVKLGLGDFVFYSVLVGRASLFDMLTVFASFIGIVTGLFCTILLLAVWRKALPALPISIFFGIIFYFLSRIFLYPFATSLLISGIVV